MNDTIPSDSICSGLTSVEVAERVALGQVNRVRRSDGAAYADIVFRNTFTLFNALVVPAAISLFWLDEYRSAISVSGMAVINLILGLGQELRAKRHLDKLALLAETRVRVLRDGQVRDVPAGEIVLGDLILLMAGEPVVADGPVVESRFLEVDEALLTGESDPVPRRPGDPLLSGSFCVTGEGSYRADHVGTAAFAHRTAAEARRYSLSTSPMQDSINRLIHILTAIAIIFCAAYGILFYLGSIAENDLVLMAAATVTSMVPQGLVLMATLAFTLGAVRMSRRGALVQRLNAVESMASIDTLCMDKTGTLTTNQLHLEELRVATPHRSEEEVRSLLCLFASASLDRGSKSVAALRAALGETKTEVLDQLPFKSQNRFSAVRIRVGHTEQVLVLGACESLRPFVKVDIGAPWENTWKEMLGTGWRLLLFAETDDRAIPRKNFDGSLDGFLLKPLGLAALSDELRPEAKQVLHTLAEQGIDFKVISGDNPETVRATVAPLGAGSDLPALRSLADAPVVSGAELDAATDPATLIRDHCVFGRVSPWQKVEIVRMLKTQGRQVAMIGDGVNDVLPIKTANLGIAMGEGSRASKIVAGLVLETNDFSLLPETLEEGRTIVRNLRRAGKLFLVKNVFTLILIVGTLGVFRLAFPFLPQQVTLLNLLTIGVPAFLLTLSRTRSGAPSQLGYVREVGSFALVTGAVIGLAGLLTQVLSAWWWEEDVLTQRTLLLSVLVLLGGTTLLRVLTHGEARSAVGDRYFRWLPVAAVAIYLPVLYLPPAAKFFELSRLTLAQWLRVLMVVVPSYGLLRLSDWLESKKKREDQFRSG